jgi:hypothetical protein
VECRQLTQNLVSFSKQIADVETIHLEEHVFKCAEIQESPSKLLVSCSKETNHIFAVVIEKFILLYQPILDELSLALDLIEVLFEFLSIVLLVFFQPFVDCADNQLHWARLIVLDKNSPRALGHHL